MFLCTLDLMSLNLMRLKVELTVAMVTDYLSGHSSKYLNLAKKKVSLVIVMVT